MPMISRDLRIYTFKGETWEHQEGKVVTARFGVVHVVMHGGPSPKDTESFVTGGRLGTSWEKAHARQNAGTASLHVLPADGPSLACYYLWLFRKSEP